MIEKIAIKDIMGKDWADKQAAIILTAMDKAAEALRKDTGANADAVDDAVKAANAAIVATIRAGWDYNDLLTKNYCVFSASVRLKDDGTVSTSFKPSKEVEPSSLFADKVYNSTSYYDAMLSALEVFASAIRTGETEEDDKPASVNDCKKALDVFIKLVNPEKACKRSHVRAIMDKMTRARGRVSVTCKDVKAFAKLAFPALTSVFTGDDIKQNNIKSFS